VKDEKPDEEVKRAEKEMRRMSVTGDDERRGGGAAGGGEEPEKKSKASKEGLKGVLRTGWEKVKDFLAGKKVVQDRNTGEIVIKVQEKIEESEDTLTIEDWIDEEEDGVVEVEIVKDRKEEDSDDISILSVTAETDTYSFLDNVQEKKKDTELEKRKADLKKRKREPEISLSVNTKG
jgi:hypothetical protein